MNRPCLRKCGKLSRIRGLCHACYAKSHRRVKASEVSWRELEARGEAVAPDPDAKARWVWGKPAS